MVIVAAAEAYTLTLDVSWFDERILYMCAIDGARNFDGMRSYIEHIARAMLWFEDTMAPTLDRMMERLQDMVLRLQGTKGGEMNGRKNVSL